MRNLPHKLHSFLTRFFPGKLENGSDNQETEIQNFGVWMGICEQILAKPYPPHSSDFPEEEIERDRHLSFTKLSNWEIVCQEILDTEFTHVYYQNCYDELLKRGKSEQEIIEMRRLAWYTAGWLNFPMLVWDWVSLGESDILLAIEKLYEGKQISQGKRAEFELLVKHHSA